MGDKNVPPKTPSALSKKDMKSGIQWYDSPTLNFQRRAKSDVPKNSEMEEDPFFGKKMENEETSNSCDGFNARLPFTRPRKFRRSLRPSNSSHGMNEKEGEEKTESENYQTDGDVTSSPASSSSFQANGDDILELGRRSIQLLKNRCHSFTADDDCDITTPKRKRKLEDEDEENNKEIEKEDEEDEGEGKAENGGTKSVTLLTPSLTRGTNIKRPCNNGTGMTMGTPLSAVASCSIHTPRRNSGARSSNKREELIDTPENSQKREEKGKEEEEKEEEEKEVNKKEMTKEEKKSIRREKYGDKADFDSDDSFYDSD